MNGRLCWLWSRKGAFFATRQQFRMLTVDDHLARETGVHVHVVEGRDNLDRFKIKKNGVIVLHLMLNCAHIIFS